MAGLPGYWTPGVGFREGSRLPEPEAGGKDFAGFSGWTGFLSFAGIPEWTGAQQVSCQRQDQTLELQAEAILQQVQVITAFKRELEGTMPVQFL